MVVGRLHNCSNIYRMQFSVIRWNWQEVKFRKQNFKISTTQLLLSITTLIHGLSVRYSTAAYHVYFKIQEEAMQGKCITCRI